MTDDSPKRRPSEDLERLATIAALRLAATQDALEALIEELRKLNAERKAE